MHKALPAITMAVIMLVSGAAPALAASTAASDEVSVAVTQDDGVTVTVTDNGTAVNGSAVSVEALDENVSYAGVGDYTTDENGTVSLPAPDETVNVSVTATVDNTTASTTATLTAENETNSTFGEQVSAFVQALQDGNATEGPPGRLIATFVLANNPSDSIPSYAGPTNESENETAGPPEDKGPKNSSENKTTGPPDDNGPPEDKGPKEKDDDDDNGPPEDNGPPDKAGSSGNGNGDN